MSARTTAELADGESLVAAVLRSLISEVARTHLIIGLIWPHKLLGRMRDGSGRVGSPP